MRSTRSASYRPCRCLAALLCCLVLACGTPSFALTFPDLSPSIRISQLLSHPEDVTVAGNGTIYVVDGKNDRVVAYTGNGVFVRTLTVNTPSAVAVSKTGNIYIASSVDRSVQIFSAAGQAVGFLGSGAGEFALPKNIVVDPAGENVFVVDTLDHSIRVYDPMGKFLARIDDYPNQPLDLAIVGSTLYVLDQPIVADLFGGEMFGARIMLYDSDGTPRTSFDLYGTGEGQLLRPKGISSDAAGRIYVADAFHGVVLCFDGSGNYLGSVQDPDIPMKTPMGMATNPMDGSLVVAAPTTGSIRVFRPAMQNDPPVSPPADPPDEPLPPVQAMVRFPCKLITWKSSGKFVAFLRLPADLPKEFRLESISIGKVNDQPLDPVIVPAKTRAITQTGRNLFDLKIFFEMKDLRRLASGETKFTICGTLTNGIPFEGSGSVVITGKRRGRGSAWKSNLH